MCGGNLLHFPCSRIGHIARFQPYSFPGGRRHIEAYNYKRAMDVWMEPNHKKFVYDHYPEMEVCFKELINIRHYRAGIPSDEERPKIPLSKENKKNTKKNLHSE